MIAVAPPSAAPLAACDYCGLPLPATIRWSWPWRKQSPPQNVAVAAPAVVSNEPVYCCSGCRFAADVSHQQQGEYRANRWLIRLLASLFLTVNVTMITMVLWSLDVYGVPESLHENTAVLLAEVLRWASWLLSLPVLWMLGAPLAAEAKSQLRQGRIATDALLLAGVVAALGYSGISLWRGTGAVYCEIACVVLLLVTLGRWLESLGKIRATAAIDALAALLPTTVRRLRRDQVERSLGQLNEDDYEQVPLAAVLPGDRIWIMAGERIPVDARIVGGRAAVDEQFINGESQPRTREIGDDVPGGGLSLDGSLILECTAASQHSSLNRIVQAVRAAQLEAGNYQQLVERIAAWFTPLVLLIALVTLGIHLANGSGSDGLLAALAVILIACPCALGIATPLAVWTSMGRASQAQVLFRNGKALERLAGASVLLFDKTGTLTLGTSRLTEIQSEHGFSPGLALRYARRLAAHSRHPLSQALVQAAKNVPAEAGTEEQVELEEVQTLPGYGLCALQCQQFANDDTPRVAVLLGSARLMDQANADWPPELSVWKQAENCADQSVVFLAVADRVRAGFLLAEAIRPEFAPLIARLLQQSWQIELLSGDQPERVARLTKELDLPGEGGLLPLQKKQRIQEHQQHGRTVVMVGDGINDAPALAAADVGIALGCGADLARQSADICLLGDDLTRIPWAVELSRKTLAIVRQNLAWAFGYNAIGIGMAVAGRLNPVWAAFFMVAGSLVVIANSMRLGVFPLLSDVLTTVEPALTGTNDRAIELPVKELVPS